METLTFNTEKELLNTYAAVAGIDEAGRGPLAGPVVAGVVVFNQKEIDDTDWWHPIRDSKKLTEKKREALFPLIIEHAQAYGIADIGIRDIETHNILGATFLAMQKAITKASLSDDVLLLVDGSQKIPNIKNQKTIVSGDSLVLSIAAASILAKVMRDKIMLKYHEKYPVYRFNQHKGYGTKQHRAMITKHGPCPIHRLSFLTKILSSS